MIRVSTHVFNDEQESGASGGGSSHDVVGLTVVQRVLAKPRDRR